MTLTIAILTKNEESNIAECIRTVKAYGEVVVVDSKSEDLTRLISENLGIKVIEFKWNGHYPRKKQWALDNLVMNDWIMLLDADERPTEEFLKEVSDLTRDAQYVAASCRMDQYIFGKRLKYGHKDSKIFLLNRKFCKFPDLESTIRGYGDIEFHYQPTCKGKVYKMKNNLQHNDNDSITSWMARHVKYATIENEITRDSATFKTMIQHKNLTGRIYYKFGSNPLLFFIYSYFFRLGFLDGYAGFAMIFLKSWYYMIIKIVKFEKNLEKHV